MHTHSRIHARADGSAPRNACAAASAHEDNSSPILKPQPPNPQVLKKLVPCTERILAVGCFGSTRLPVRRIHAVPVSPFPFRAPSVPSVPLQYSSSTCSVLFQCPSTLFNTTAVSTATLSLTGKHAALESALQTGADPNQVQQPAAAPMLISRLTFEGFELTETLNPKPYTLKIP